jgi:hypothetical protein
MVVVLAMACGNKGGLGVAGHDGSLATGGHMTATSDGSWAAEQDLVSSTSGVGGSQAAGGTMVTSGSGGSHGGTGGNPDGTLETGQDSTDAAGYTRDATGRMGDADVSVEVAGIEDTAAPAIEVSCDTDSLWKAVAFATNGEAVSSECFASPVGSSGTLTFDDQGKVIDISTSYLMGFSSKGAWLAWLANDRWPCLASQSIQYQCLTPSCCGP